MIARTWAYSRRWYCRASDIAQPMTRLRTLSTDSSGELPGVCPRLTMGRRSGERRDARAFCPPRVSGESGVRAPRKGPATRDRDIVKESGLARLDRAAITPVIT